MADIAAIVASLGGMAQKRQLVKRGANDLDLTMAVRRREVVRVRNGWYTTMSEKDDAVRAVRVGGRLTGISAIVALGGWVLHRPAQLHVSVPLNAARLRTATNRFRRLDVAAKGTIALHWDSRDLSGRGSATSVGLLDALLRVALDEDWETTIAAFDWALHTGRIEMFDVEVIALQLPVRLKDLPQWVDPDCESLPESLARTRLRLEGHVVRSQVRIGEGLDRIDLVVDEVVALETDGEKFHIARFEPDRSKDLDITIDGWHALRPAANHVFHDWTRVYRAVTAALAARGVVIHEISGVAPRCEARGRRTTRKPVSLRNLTPEFPWRRREWGRGRE
jgi:very-short-patch-repair endonuclease